MSSRSLEFANLFQDSIDEYYKAHKKTVGAITGLASILKDTYHVCNGDTL